MASVGEVVRPLQIDNILSIVSTPLPKPSRRGPPPTPTEAPSADPTASERPLRALRQLRELGIDDAEAARLGRSRTARLRLVRAIFVLALQLRARIDRQLAGDGLTSQQAAVMTVVRAGRPSFREVARTLGTSPQNVRQLVDVLVRKGFARVVDDPSDRRVKRLVATPKNARYWSARDDADHGELLALFDDLDTAEVERTVASLLTVLDRAHPREVTAAERTVRPGKQGSPRRLTS